VNKENMSFDQHRQRWFIDLDWYQKNNRSFIILARSRMCPKCQERLMVGEGEVSPSDILANIKNCCSQATNFISGELPILESVFRFFLGNGNEPVDVEELGKRLSEWRGRDTYRTSDEILPHLLNSDQYYGLRQVQT